MVLLISFAMLPCWVAGLRSVDRLKIQQLSEIRFQVDINRATSEELQAIPSVGPKLADKIVAYRTMHGFYSDLEEIRQVPGLGENLLSRIRPFLTIDEHSGRPTDDEVVLVIREE